MVKLFRNKLLLIFWPTCRTFAAVGVDPAIMGVGPAVAIPAAVKAAGLELSDIDLFEINEVYVKYVKSLYSFSCSFSYLVT